MSSVSSGLGGGEGVSGSPPDVRRGLGLILPTSRQVIDKEVYQCHFLDFSFAMAAVCRVKSHAGKDWNKTSFLLSLSEADSGGGREGSDPLLGAGGLPWFAGQAGTKKQATATQAGTNAPTHHTSRHPNGTFVPLMKEAETIRCGWSRASVGRTPWAGYAPKTCFAWRVGMMPTQPPRTVRQATAPVTICTQHGAAQSALTRESGPQPEPQFPYVFHEGSKALPLLDFCCHSLVRLWPGCAVSSSHSTPRHRAGAVVAPRDR